VIYIEKENSIFKTSTKIRRKKMLHKEADVVVIGYGGAGAAAAITAHDNGAKVIVLEKMDNGGGNTKCAGGTIRKFLDIDKATTYFRAILPKSVSNIMVRTFVEEVANNAPWIESLGGELACADGKMFPPGSTVVWPFLKGADGVGGRWALKELSLVGGTDLWRCLSKNVEKRNVEVLLNTPAKRLIRNVKNEIIGVVAESPDGEIQINARRGTILTCGGFQSNSEMLHNYLGLDFLAEGCPGNTGDGIRMAQAVGADLWHMSSVSCGLGYKFPDYDFPIGLAVRVPEYIWVDQHGKRFTDECGTDMHAMAFAFTYLDHGNLTYPRIPGYMIVDQSTIQSGPLVSRCPGVIGDYYQWSKDNSEEIKKGWFKKANTIRELAPQIGIRSDVLQQTVSKYNAFCYSGYDPEFGRRQETLSPISKPPFYAIAVWPCLINTQGGPRRDAQAQVIDVFGKPIKRLYSAGEIGSIFGMLYPGSGNVNECIAFGRIAGRNAAAQSPWNGK
jgi:succinate dehydrogenase/fumarate reductase flavoprotein subunit